MLKNISLSIIMMLLFGVVVLGADGFQHDGDIHTPDYYEHTVRKAFKRGDWNGGKRLLDEGLEHYPEVSGLNELAGSYYLHHQAYDDARYHLVKAVRDNDGNVQAKQMLVDVEEKTKNYSSAICYVNELLQVNPYWKGLWRRKIALFRKQGNNVEADRLLKRICQIYPNDATLKRDLAGRLEEQYLHQRKSGNKNATIASLRELVNQNPHNEEYYLALSNLLLQQGNRTEAMDIADRGVHNMPGSSALIIKKAGILAEENRYGEAMAYVKQCMKQNGSGRLRTFYNSLQLDAARAEANQDPYVLYGKVFEKSKSEESLNYLLSTAMSRGYYEDALYYIGQARKRRGDTPDLLYKAYVINKRMGNERTANGLLTRLYERTPHNEEVADALASLRLEQSRRLMDDGAYAEALQMLKFVTEHSADRDTRESAFSRIYTCNMELRRYDAAEEALIAMHTNFPSRSDYVGKRADLLVHRGRLVEALRFLKDEADKADDEFLRYQYISTYEEIAAPYIKNLVANGAIKKAFEESENLLKLYPASERGLQYAINSAAKLGYWSEFSRLVMVGRQNYPDDRFYLVKQATILHREGKYADALDMLRSSLDDYAGDTLLVKAFSASSIDWANLLIKHHQPDSAIALVDTAMVFDRENRSLLYTKGLAFEAKHMYDSAYVYQKYYLPGFGEYASFYRHLGSLQAHSHRNALNFEYLQGRFGEVDQITAVATAEYTRKLNDRNDMAVRMNYAGREGAVANADPSEQTSGGTGIQLQGEWTHRFGEKWQATAAAAWANKYFPQWYLSAQVQRNYKNDWEAEVHANYRRIHSYQKAWRMEWDTYNEDLRQYGLWSFDHWDHSYSSLVDLGVGASKTLGDFWINSKLDVYLLKSKFYFNLSAQAKYYPLNDGKTCFHVLGSIGSAPEVTMIDFAMPGTFNHLNTMVGFGGQYRLLKNVSVGVLGTWYTYYVQTQKRATLSVDPSAQTETHRDYSTMNYKNLFNIDAQLSITF